MQVPTGRELPRGNKIKEEKVNNNEINNVVNKEENEDTDKGNEKQEITKSTDYGFYGDVVGKCPKCGNDVIRNRFGYGCKNYSECSFKISGNICKRTISIENVRLLLESGKTSKIEGFISKGGKDFSATLKFDNDYKLVFDFKTDAGILNYLTEKQFKL